jgi:hypothetical protein
MHFSTKSYLKSTRNHTAKHALIKKKMLRATSRLQAFEKEKKN